jgi:hypothetical protein
VLNEIESVLSDLPEKIKAMFKFQFSKTRFKIVNEITKKNST